jgi:hypothetical protein
VAAISRILSSFDDNTGTITINFDSITGVASTLALNNTSIDKTLTITIRLTTTQMLLFSQSLSPGQSIGIFDISVNAWTVGQHLPPSGLVDWSVTWS